MERPSANNDFQSGHARLLLTSYRRCTGRALVEVGLSDLEAARRLFTAPFVVASHGSQDDPILNYGNEAALRLWEIDWAHFTQMPSRLTAEPLKREARAAMIARAKQLGFIDDYSGIRISATGRRFQIDDAVIWSVEDDTGLVVGQAATFETVAYL